MNEEQKITLLKEEYFHLQKVLEDFDSKSMTIKTWSVTGSLAAIAAGLVQEIGDKAIVTSPALFLVGAIEVFWKTFQQAYHGRILAIEKYFKSTDSYEIFPLQISHYWSENWRARRKFKLRIMFWPHVALPHVVIFFIGCFLFLQKMHFSCE